MKAIFKNDDLEPCIVISPDKGNQKECIMFAQLCNRYLFVEKVRDRMDKETVIHLRVAALGYEDDKGKPVS
jgi:hypothetical protein